MSTYFPFLDEILLDIRLRHSSYLVLLFIVCTNPTQDVNQHGLRVVLRELKFISLLKMCWCTAGRQVQPKWASLRGVFVHIEEWHASSRTIHGFDGGVLQFRHAHSICKYPELGQVNLYGNIAWRIRDSLRVDPVDKNLEDRGGDILKIDGIGLSFNPVAFESSSEKGRFGRQKVFVDRESRRSVAFVDVYVDNGLATRCINQYLPWRERESDLRKGLPAISLLLACDLRGWALLASWWGCEIVNGGLACRYTIASQPHYSSHREILEGG